MTLDRHSSPLTVSAMCEAVREIAEQIIPEELYAALLRVSLERSGADSGYLFLVNSDDRLRLVADAHVGNSLVETRVYLESTPSPAGLPEALLDHVKMTLAPLVLADTRKEYPFADVDTLPPKPARSVACLPLVRRRALVGLLYLEHALLTDVFTMERVTLLNLLAEQATSSLENARRHAALIEENEKFQKLNEELSLQRNLLRTFAESMPHRIYAKDTETRFIFGNMAVARGMGVSHPDELLGKTDFGFYPPECAEQYRREEQEIMASGIPLMDHEEHTNYLLTNSEAWILTTKVPLRDDDGKVIGIAGINYNITERKKMELELADRNAELLALNTTLANTQAQLLQSEKLASLGQLAAGVAHEINNPIGYIFSNFDTLSSYLARLFQMLAAYEEAEPFINAPNIVVKLKALCDEIDLAFLKDDIPALMTESKEGISRVRQIVQDLKDFSHVDNQAEWQFANLHQGIDATLNIINSEIKHKVDVVKEYGDIPEVECLSSQINQVIMNLLINAAQAIESADHGRGTITIRTGTCKGLVWVDVADTGCGMLKESMSRIFDPFYTTKPVGKGTGLGLSLAHGIMQKHNGKIEVHSVVGKGSVFRIVLPITHDVAEGCEASE